ncbi:MAG: YdcF family protein [Candidatus Woesearchaeota archaeon]
MTQKIPFTSLEAALILGGAQIDAPNRAAVANAISDLLPKEIPVVVSGKHGWGGEEVVTHAENLYSYLNDSLQERVTLEEEACDTYANMVFSQPLIKGAKDVLVITDAYHMPRAKCFAEHVFTERTRIHALSTSNNANSLRRAEEAFVKYALLTDFALFGVEKHNIQAHQDFLFTRNPLHAKNPKISVYGSALNTYVAVRNAREAVFGLQNPNPQ